MPRPTARTHTGDGLRHVSAYWLFRCPHRNPCHARPETNRPDDLKDYALSWHGTHGVCHWARVLENGLRLAELTGANRDVVRLFAIFHDSRRVNESTDCGYGQSGAKLAAQLRGEVFDLPDSEFELLCAACGGHEHGMIDASVTVQTCWDADRLDLGRVGMCLDPTKLCTDASRHPDIMRWADGRAAFKVVSEIVSWEWGIETSGWRYDYHEL